MDVTDVAHVDIRVLGPLSVAVDGRIVAIGSPKQRAVLAMLALHGRVSLDTLADELWRETPPASLAATVHTLVSRLRRTLVAAGSGLTISADGGVYVMDAEPDQVDVHRFHELAAEGRAAREVGSADAARCFRKALALWRGPALADLVDRDFARVAAARLNEARLDVAEDLADAELAAGRPAAALDTVEPITRDHPFRERLRGLHMLSLYRLGRQAEALAAYQDLRRTLADELGLEPTSSLQALERQILQQSPELDQRAPLAATAPPDSSGTLTFLFTDIEASTRLWEGDRAAMAADLARHDTVLKEAVAAHHGHQFAHTGDGLGAAFPTVADALGAAVAGQRKLSSIPWRGVAPLRVRMAIHAGTAEARAGTFFGPNLNRTARLLDLAGGGQILCSQAAADLGRDELPAGAALLDFGERRLEGLSRPERVWQVVHPDLPDPAAVIAPPARRQEALTSFVGREAELAELTALLRGTRLLTIFGVGGAGKTRLALELAARMDKHYADGTGIVELATVRDDRPLADHVLSALGAGGGGGRSGALAAEDQLCQVLGDRQLLLVLDNCEHVLDAATALVDTVLRHCPGVTVLATSREVLSVPGETTWAAPGLSLPPAEPKAVDDLDGSDAAALFLVRARTAQPGFGPSPSNAGAISRICHRLDGIPLALELAASRVRALGVTNLADRLEDRLRLLTAGPRSAPARHQTLRAAMDWSFDLLTETEQRLLRRLSVFPQNFDLEAATAVAADDADPIEVLDLFARLIDKSLVVPEGMADTARYRLLEIVRQYAGEKLEAAGETEAIRRRHRRHFVDRILAAYRAGTGVFQIEWGQHVAIDGENYNAALASGLVAGDLEAATVILAGRGLWFWGEVPTAVDSIDPDVLTAADPSIHVAALITLGAAGVNRGRWTVETAFPICERALAIAEERGTPADEGFACVTCGYLALGRGDSQAARTWMERALRCFADVPVGQYYARHELGWIELTEGNVAAAREHFESILTVLELRSGSESQVAHLRAAVALCEAADGNGARALPLARQALDESRRIAFPGIEVMALVRVSEVAALSGAPIGAELVEALHLLRRQGGLRWAAAALTMAAVAHDADGRPDTAARLLGGAGRVAEMLAEDPLPLAPVASLVMTMRHRIEAALGTEASTAAETAGKRLPVPALLDLALNGLAG